MEKLLKAKKKITVKNLFMKREKIGSQDDFGIGSFSEIISAGLTSKRIKSPDAKINGVQT